MSSEGSQSSYLDCLSLYDFEEDPLNCLLCITSDTTSGFWDWICAGISTELNSCSNKNVVYSNHPSLNRINTEIPQHNYNDFPQRRSQSQEVDDSNYKDLVNLHINLVNSLFDEQETQMLSRSTTFRRNKRKVAVETKNSSPFACLSKECKLQKDKGNGVEPGSDICAAGKEETLAKIREKVQIIVKARNATVSKTPAKLIHANPIETRSMLRIKMGFLSMNYGILLQWNPSTKLVDLVVLRKMVASNFMNVQSDAMGVDRLAMLFCQGWCNPSEEDLLSSIKHSETPFPSTQSQDVLDVTPRFSNATKSRAVNSFVLREVVDSNAIIETSSSSNEEAMEVTTLCPPYTNPKPTHSKLIISVTSIRNLHLHSLFTSLRNKKKLSNSSIFYRLNMANQIYTSKKYLLSSNVFFNDKKKSDYFAIRAPSENVPHLMLEIFCLRGKLRRKHLIAEAVIPMQKYLERNRPTFQLMLPLTFIASHSKSNVAFVHLTIVYENLLHQWIQEELRQTFLSQRLFLTS